MDRFTGKTVIVTGAGSGIGAATARRFSAEGANVVLADREQAGIDRVAAGLPRERALAHAADVSDEEAVNALVAATVDRFGGLDVLVNNAGVAVSGAIDEAPVADWHKVIAVNVTGVMLCTRAVIPHLARSRGCIVNTSSASGLGGDWGLSFYNASKGAVTNFTRAAALDLGARGIRVNAVNPSFTRTGMTTAFEADEGIVAKFLDRIPLGRLGEADDVAAVIAFLASDDARFVTGVNLPVDGGVSASNGQPRLG